MSPDGMSRARPVLRSTYLDQIIPAVRCRLERHKHMMPLRELQILAAREAPESFAAALHTSGLSLIAEIKRASPSKGPIRPDLDVRQTVEAYQAAGARAVSVLTEEDYFLGGLNDLQTAAACTHLPVLRKDFIIDPYQVFEARAFGASAVLLIAALLGDEQLHHLTELAHEVGLDVLLEVHDKSELKRALTIDKVIIGVNNRDLRSFAVSLETTACLASSVPPDRILVSESGIRDRGDVEWLASCGVDAILVGESLLRSSEVQRAVRAMVQPAPVVADRSVYRAQGKEVS